VYTRKLWFLVLFVWLLPGDALAHRHRADVFVSYSLLKSSDFDGLSLQGSWPIAKEREFSWIGSFSRYSGEDEGKDFTLLAYSGGLRYRARIYTYTRWFVVGQLWIGAVDTIEKLDASTSRHRTDWIAGGGPGIEFRLGGDFQRWSLRLQTDLVHRFNGKTGPAFSVGFAWEGRDLTP